MHLIINAVLSCFCLSLVECNLLTLNELHIVETKSGFRENSVDLFSWLLTFWRAVAILKNLFE